MQPFGPVETPKKRGTDDYEAALIARCAYHHGTPSKRTKQVAAKPIDW